MSRNAYRALVLANVLIATACMWRHMLTHDWRPLVIVLINLWLGAWCAVRGKLGD